MDIARFNPLGFAVFCYVYEAGDVIFFFNGTGERFDRLLRQAKKLSTNKTKIQSSR